MRHLWVLLSFALGFSAQLGARPNPPSGLTFGLPERISLVPNGAEPDAPSFSPSVSADGPAFAG